MKRLTIPFVLLLAALALTAAGCGSKESEEESATPAEAISELATIRTMLDSAAADYKAGDAKKAEETVGDAYLEHFEHVEGPLGDRDHELMEELEERISTELRDKMKDGAPASEIDKLVAETKHELDEAKAKLGS